MKNNSILVIGDIMLDVYLEGSVDRISPEAPVPVFLKKERKEVLGGASNVLRNLKSFKCNSEILGVIGNDKEGDSIITQLNSTGCSTNFIFRTNRPTTTKTRILSNKHQIIRIDNEINTPIDDKLQHEIIKKLEANIGNFNIVILSDYGKGLLPNNFCRKIISICNDNDVKVLADPKGTNFQKYKGVYLLTPNKMEAEKALGFSINSEEDVHKALIELKKITNSNQQIITLSEKGISYIEKSNFEILPAVAKDVYDVTGAGDTVIASIGHQLNEGKNLKESIKFANLAASVVVGKSGSAIATLEEISKINTDGQTIFSSIEEFMSIVKIDRSNLTFTNGCFDILHSGHLMYLKEASKLGKILVVGLNSDRSVKLLKGNDRPINDQKERASNLSAIRWVDYVILFEEKTPHELIKKLRPKNLVKGGDYKLNEIVGREYAMNTIIIPFKEGMSTSNVIHKIQNLDSQ